MRGGIMSLWRNLHACMAKRCLNLQRPKVFPRRLGAKTKKMRRLAGRISGDCLVVGHGLIMSLRSR